MNSEPAIALLEFTSVAHGIKTADAMVKRAPITLFVTGTVHPGKYIIVVGGSVAATEEAYREGIRQDQNTLTDQIFLPDVHTQVYEAIQGQRQSNQGEALGVIELSSIPSVVRAADRAVKTTNVTIIDIRLGDGLGGKGLLQLSGDLHAVQEAITAGLDSITNPDTRIHSTIIPTQHPDLRAEINQTSTFTVGK